MRRAIAISLLLMFSSIIAVQGVLKADEFYTVLTEIDPESARKIIHALLETDVAECMIMMRSIGRMEDPHITDMLMILSENLPNVEKNKPEFLIRLLLESVFNASLADKDFNKRISSNRDGLDFLMKRIGSMNDRFLKGKLINLVPRMNDPRYGPLILNEGFKIVSLLERNDGNCSVECEAEINDLLITAGILQSKDFLDLCIEIERLTKNSDLYKKARETARLISIGLHR